MIGNDLILGPVWWPVTRYLSQDVHYVQHWFCERTNKAESERKSGSALSGICLCYLPCAFEVKWSKYSLKLLASTFHPVKLGTSHKTVLHSLYLVIHFGKSCWRWATDDLLCKHMFHLRLTMKSTALMIFGLYATSRVVSIYRARDVASLNICGSIFHSALMVD